MSQHVVILAVIGLLAAYQRGDRDTVAHRGASSSLRDLSGALAAPLRAERLAAIEASRSAGNSAWVLLSPLAERARERDRRVAAAAARSAVSIARQLDRRRVLEWELPVDDLRERLVAWREVAGDRGRWPDVRVHALETCALLHAALGASAGEAPYDLARLLADPEPEVRRAALELLPVPLPAALRPSVAARLLEDDDPAVAVAAGQALCTELALDEDPAPALAALGDDGLARLRALIADPAAPPAAAVDAARCLAADPDPRSAEALRALGRGRPSR